MKCVVNFSSIKMFLSSTILIFTRKYSSKSYTRELLDSSFFFSNILASYSTRPFFFTIYSRVTRLVLFFLQYTRELLDSYFFFKQYTRELLDSYTSKHTRYSTRDLNSLVVHTIIHKLYILYI